MGYLLVATALVSVVLGFGAGFLTFKRSTRWCPECGAVLRCPECADRLPRHRTLPGAAGSGPGSGALRYGSRNIA